MPETLYFGSHTLHFVDPGIAVVTYRGVVTGDEMRAICEVPDVPAHAGRFQLTICDLRELDRITPEARKVGSERLRPAAIYYYAYVGANFATRVMVGLWTRGTNFVHGEKNEIDFFADLTAAKAWLLTCRERHQAA